MNNKLFFSSELQTGKTPTDLYNDLDKEFNFDFDHVQKTQLLTACCVIGNNPILSIHLIINKKHG